MKPSHLGTLVAFLSVGKTAHEQALQMLQQEILRSTDQLEKAQKLETYKVALGAYIMRAEHYEYHRYEKWLEEYTEKK